MGSDEVDGVLRVEELRVGQPLLPIVDEATQLFVQKSGHCFGALVVRVLDSVADKALFSWGQYYKR